jgi:hypothetical protein
MFSDHLTDAQRTEWDSINSALGLASADRNKIAHYSIEFDFLEKETKEDGSISLELWQPHLRPSIHNTVDSLKGRTPEKPGHKLTPVEMRSYVNKFNGLGGRLSAFRKSISLPAPQQGAGLLSGLLPFLEKPNG